MDIKRTVLPRLLLNTNNKCFTWVKGNKSQLEALDKADLELRVTREDLLQTVLYFGQLRIKSKVAFFGLSPPVNYF